MPTQWPSSRDYVEAIQNPSLCFQDPDLKAASPAVDRLGMPFVTSGQFAYVFKLNGATGGAAEAVRCFRGGVGDREQRYRLINDHLNKVSAPYFASFEYDPEGMLVLGKRYPVLVMEWIDGFPLDVYLQNILGRPDVLRFLAELWLKALLSLRSGGMAHGDLQHGNIIVDTNNSLRLVDLDGMFVPAMSGWRAGELGHRHYQHPKRSPKQFNANLDNFSGLVIYLSFLSLAEAPQLWAEYHDENLIFTKADFDNPRASPLLSKIKRLGSDHQRLAAALEKACIGDPENCPSVLDLVNAPPSKLPAWMVNAPAVTISQTTREVKPGTQPPPPAFTAPPSGTTANASTATGAVPPAWPGQSAGMPIGTASPFPATTVSAPASSSSMVRAGARHALNYAFIGVFFVWLWYPMLRALFLGIGVQPADVGLVNILAFAAICSALGCRRAHAESKTPGVLSVPTTPPISAATRPSTPTVIRSPIARPATMNLHSALVGSRIRRVYHKPHCRWANQISFRNRVPFGSVTDAKAAGYRPCGVCSP